MKLQKRKLQNKQKKASKTIQCFKKGKKNDVKFLKIKYLLSALDFEIMKARKFCQRNLLAY